MSRNGPGLCHQCFLIAKLSDHPEPGPYPLLTSCPEPQSSRVQQGPRSLPSGERRAHPHVCWGLAQRPGFSPTPSSAGILFIISWPASVSAPHLLPV